MVKAKQRPGSPHSGRKRTSQKGRKGGRKSVNRSRSSARPKLTKAQAKQRDQRQAAAGERRRKVALQSGAGAALAAVTILVVFTLLQPPVAAKAPDFTVTTSDGSAYTLSQQRGQVVLVEFMFVDCPACRAQLPALQNIYADHQEEGFEIFALSIYATDSAADLEDYRERVEAPWRHGLYKAQPITAYHVRGTPTLALVDPEGLLVKQWFGVVEEAELRAVIEPLL